MQLTAVKLSVSIGPKDPDIWSHIVTISQQHPRLEIFVFGSKERQGFGPKVQSLARTPLPRPCGIPYPITISQGLGSASTLTPNAIRNEHCTKKSLRKDCKKSYCQQLRQIMASVWTSGIYSGRSFNSLCPTSRCRDLCTEHSKFKKLPALKYALPEICSIRAAASIGRVSYW